MPSSKRFEKDCTFFHSNLFQFQFNGRASIALKGLFLAWLLLPIPLAGSSVIFDLILAPVHGTFLQLASDAQGLARSCLVSVLDDVLQPLVTSALTTAEAGLQLGWVTILQCREVITPPLSCAGALVLNSPSLLLTSITDTVNSVLNIIDIVSLYIYDIFNSLVSYGNNFLHLLASVTYSIIEETLVLFEDPVNVIKRYSTTVISSCQYFATKAADYYHYNERNPLFFSDIFRGRKEILFSGVLTISKKVYTILVNSTRALNLKVLPVAGQLVSNVKYFSKVSFNVVYQWFSKMQLALSEFLNYLRITIFDKVTKFSSSFIFFFQNCLRICLSEILRLCLKVYDDINDLTIYLVKSISNHINQNQKQPRLFSQLFKQMIRHVK